MADLSAYDCDMDCFQSYANLRNRIYYNQIKEPAKHRVIQHTQHVAKNKKVTHMVESPANDPSIVMLIQNDIRFINLLMCCRKQKNPSAYVFCESGSYLSVVIKAGNEYPITLVRLPIDNVYVYSTNTNTVYNFPIVDILGKDYKFSRSNSYVMMFRLVTSGTTQSIEFVYELWGDSPEPNRLIISNVLTNNKTTIDNLFRIQSTSISDISNTLNTLVPVSAEAPAGPIDTFSYYDTINTTVATTSGTIDNLVKFYAAKILLIYSVIDVDNVIQLQPKQQRSTNYFSVNPSGLVFVTSQVSSKNEKHLASAEDALMWRVESAIDIDLFPFDLLFKINYKKLALSTDHIYYVLADIGEDHYVFIKIVTGIDVTGVNGGTLGEVFNNASQVLEIFGGVKHVENLVADTIDVSAFGAVTEFAD